VSRRSLNAVVRYLQQLAHTQSGSGASDAELLERYVRHRDETAFELLVWRHGALVFNVCRRILPCEQDAEDAFQATFLAFVRKSGSISRRGSVAAWLYRVAFRVALAAKARRVKIAAHEKPFSEVQAAAAVNDPKWAELRPILDEEVNRLPERLRWPFVLCYLEGKTNEEAARQLGCPPGTIFSRLARGREALRRRLQRRGVTLSVTALTAALTTHAAEAMPAAALMTTTVRNAFLFAGGQAVSGVSTQVTALAEGVLRTMFMTKIKLTALMMLLAGLFAVGGVFARQALNSASQPEDSKEKRVVSVVQATPGGLQRTSLYAGHVRAVAQQQVYPVVSGYLRRIAVDIGDAVKKGDVLAEVDAPLLEMEARQARAALALEERQVLAAEAEVGTAVAEVKLVAVRASAFESKLKGDEAFVAYRKKQAERYQGLLKDRAIDARLVDEQEDQLHAAIQTLNSTKQTLQNVRSEIQGEIMEIITPCNARISGYRSANSLVP
jgi:RNA polymerase sigma factor (sigma-70 family)